MFVGMIKGDVVLPRPPNNDSYGWCGSYGWELGTHGAVYNDRFYTAETSLSDVTKQGDTVDLVLDCDAAKLSLHLPNGLQFHVEIPKSQTWRLNVTLYRSNDKIRIINE